MFEQLRARILFLVPITHRFRSNRLAMVIVFVAAILGATTVGFAGATTAGVIYACVNKSSGTIHIVTASTACATNEVALSWNTVGAQGAIGPTGATGATGPSGAATTYTVRFGGMYPGTSVARAMCEPGEHVTGGGGLATNPSSAGLTQNHPIKDTGGEIAGGTNATGWQVASEGFGDVQAYVICAR